MKQILYVLIALILCTNAFATPFSGYNPTDAEVCTSGEFGNAVSVTDTNTAVNFSADSKAIYVENTGANELYFDPRDGVAAATSTGGILLQAGEARSLSGFQTRSVGIIASSGETTTAFVEICY